ncbi:cryptochrome/photolyase family protein [Pseudoalteromonas sp. JBTF-M23]|uniref:Cryptochrome/photolyase family protein n=1 Tax=Pseudoalteromonas caenipelagi TaxID=2726988 RepID=A0A849V8L1_9GAMM|nr:cryptochrome/photolyase family protein [Pseudoalteromonas caenipelagi]NOU49110.1 cryptochrome/photolyase family protein [Pseudoalteromonas caenipelagi]
MKDNYKILRLVLGDQLNAHHSWFKDKNDDVVYVIAELHQEACYTTHHIQKVCAFFCAMENFASALSTAAHHVLHLTLDDTVHYRTLPELLSVLIERYDIKQFEYQLPDEYRLKKQLEEFSSNLKIATKPFETEHFYLNENMLKTDFKAGKSHRMEAFYRKMRKRFNILMQGDQPLGGKWNYDEQNRNKLKSGDHPKVPEPLLFQNDISLIVARIKRHKIKTIGRINNSLLWPVTRTQAKELVDYFCQHCLENFGRFQDAMSCELDDVFGQKQWSLVHSRLSFALNSKMISPAFVVNKAIDFYLKNDKRVSLSQIEGFVRQIIGWREFIRGIYWANMPNYAQLNSLSAHNPLPSWFWDGNTKMNCLRYAIVQSLDFAYAHHIQRLMVTGNFCLLAGINPDEVEQWYLGIYIDALEWVEMPNTRGMSQFADGGIVGSKAYAASGNYIKNMSDYCGKCDYDVTQIVGAKACPLNSLYWRFMTIHEAKFSNNPRQKLVYANWRKKAQSHREEILQQAETYLIEVENL